MGVFTTGGGVLCQCGVYNGFNPSLLGETYFGPAYFITRADKLLRVRINYYACYRTPTVPYTDVTFCYVKRLF